MWYRLLADLIVVAHAGFIAFVIAGGYLALRWHWMPWLHLPAAAWGAAIEFGGWICPLTPLENQLRAAGGAAGYRGGFISHYLIPLIYPAGLTRGIQLGLGAAVIAVNVTAYAIVWTRRRTSV
ncbi:MAG: DUF2784 domain-containing protein [Gemmatimonadaceae bacterium]